MANLHDLFQKFNEKITLSSSKKEYLKRGRDALREKIKKDFRDKDKKPPRFCGQGSYMMKTIVNPLPEEEYDLDDGVYFKQYKDKPKDDWPTPQTIHNWIKNAVEGHTDTPVKDKNTCIRVIYAGDYHIDLPGYILKDDRAYLAHKKKGWGVSDPKEFTEWFRDQLRDSGEQLRRVVKYLKAWKDKQEVDLAGITATILVADGGRFYKYNERDDKSLLGTVTNIINKLERDFTCYKPVTPYDEDLLEEHTDNKKNDILDRLESLKENLDKAIDEEDELKASEYLIDEFGDRFPKGENKSDSSNEGNIRTESPAVINSDGRSA